MCLTLTTILFYPSSLKESGYYYYDANTGELIYEGLGLVKILDRSSVRVETIPLSASIVNDANPNPSPSVPRTNIHYQGTMSADSERLLGAGVRNV